MRRAGGSGQGRLPRKGYDFTELYREKYSRPSKGAGIDLESWEEKNKSKTQSIFRKLQYFLVPTDSITHLTTDVVKSVGFSLVLI